MTSLLFSWYLKFKGIPSVFHAPGHVTGRYFFHFDRSTLYIANSNDTEERIYNLTGRHADGVVHPGIAYPNAYTRKALDINQPILLSVSRLSLSKGVYRLLDIFYYVKKDFPRVELLLVGQNYEGDRIINKAKELGIQDNIHLVGQVPYFEVSKYYSQADIFVHPSYPESFGMVLLEAMSYELPVVATDLPCFREASQGKVLLLPYEKTHAWSKEIYILWAREIMKLLRDPERQQEMSKVGKEIALQHIWDRKAKLYEDFLWEAIRRKRA
jgi:glycosyltransferase involved in cell wall biosynthesis